MGSRPAHQKRDAGGRSSGRASRADRLSTGDDGFDEILDGGLPRGGTYLIVGGPGTGKTVVANQIAYHTARQGGHAVYVTLLTETHSRMVTNLSSLAFFDPAAVGERVRYVSGGAALRSAGLEGLYRVVEEEVRRREATLLVIDGISLAVQMTGATPLDMTVFLNHLGALLELHGCTAVLCMLVDVGRVLTEQALADGMLELHYRRVEQVAVRELVVRKFRGSTYLEGAHRFEIDGRGAIFHPRTEARLARSLRVPSRAGPRQAFGIPGLDEMLRGGLPGGSTTVIAGAPGSGKTLLGLHFLAAGALGGERTLYFGFYESPERVVAQAESVGLPLRGAIEEGRLEIAWHRSFENLADPLVEDLLSRVRRAPVSRLVIDGLEGFAAAVIYPHRTATLLGAVSNELRALGVTTILTLENEILGRPVSAPGATAMLAENVMLLRYVELRSHLHRFISIIKVRGSDFDSSLREFHIGSDGVKVAETFESAEAILSGLARQTPPSWAAPPVGPQGG